MALHQADRADTYMVIEEVVGTNTGVNGFAWQVEGLIGTGPNTARATYAIVQKFAGFSAGHNFGIVISTVVPGIPRHSGVLYGTYYTTLDQAVTAVGTLIAALPVETAQVAGVLAATNLN